MLRLLALPLVLALVSSLLVRVGQAHTDSFFPVNDFWGLLDQATILDWKRVETWYNGFFPPGYPALLALSPGGPTPDSAWRLHAVAAGILVFGVSAAAQALTNRVGAVLAIGALWMSPLAFEALLTPGPDLVALACWALALAALWGNGDPGVPARRHLLVAGCCLGAAMLMRSHMMVIAAGTCLAFTVLQPPGRRTRVLWLLPGVAAAWLLQRGVQLASGQASYEAAQLFNIYRQVYPISWWDPPRALSMTLGQMLAQEPVRYLDAWLRGVQWYSPLLLPALAGAWWGIQGRFCLFALTVGLPYLLVVSIALSPRAALPLLPLFVLCLVVLLKPTEWQIPRPWSLPQWVKLSVTLLFVGCVSLLSARTNWIQLQILRAYSQDMAAVEAIVTRRGAERAAEIFSDNHEIYFQDLPGWRPSTNGTWAVLPSGAWNYEARHPHFNTSSWEAFRADCRRHGVKWLILSPDANQWTPFFQAILADALHTREWVQRIDRVQKFQIYALR